MANKNRSDKDLKQAKQVEELFNLLDNIRLQKLSVLLGRVIGKNI